MSTLKELREIRLQKLERLKQLGVNPYPSTVKKDYDNLYIKQNFDSLDGKQINVAGKIVAIRTHGKLAFIDLKDQTEKIQLYIKEENLSETTGPINFSNLDLLDNGDYIEARGLLTKTKRGEISIETHAIKLLTKSLRPAFDAWEGLKDKETRLRKRYLDTSTNEEVFHRFKRRARFWEAHREFFKQNNFLEMNIPVLEPVTGGADATPFVTHMNAIDQDFYLRISQELYLKRLIGGGYEKVYEIGPRFRNEGLSDEHLPEHMAMEYYWAYADWKDGMQFTKDLLNYVINYVYGNKKQFNIKGFEVDFSKDWDQLDYATIIKDRFNIDIFNTNLNEIKNILKQNNQAFDSKINLQRGIDDLWKIIRKTIAGPAFLVNVPKFMSPLAKSNPSNIFLTERFQPIIAGSELGNGFSELNDPIDQFDRFLEQQKLRDSGDDEAQMMDIDFVEMLEYGMPPTFGYGHTERTFWFLENVSAREGVLFPQMRHEVDDVTKAIYPQIFK